MLKTLIGFRKLYLLVIVENCYYSTSYASKYYSINILLYNIRKKYWQVLTLVIGEICIKFSTFNPLIIAHVAICHFTVFYLNYCAKIL